MTVPADQEWEVVHSTAWSGGTPAISVAVSTWRRAGFLPDLIACLEAQTLALHRFEVVVVDDASPDETWATLTGVASRTTLRLLAARMPANRGAAGGRNAATSLCRAPIVAFTDDDCLPSRGWLSALEHAFATGADAVQGRTVPEPGAERLAGPWDHSIWVTGPTPFFETCNLAYRRAWLERVGGFDEGDAFINQRRISPFGEDAVLGSKLSAAGGRVRFADDALVHHRYLPGTYSSHLRRRWQVGEFPGLARRSRLVSDALYHRVFLSRRTAACDAAIASVVAALSWRRPWPLIATVPWLRMCWQEAARRPGAPDARRLGQVAAGDLVALAALVKGSLRHRRPVL